MGEQESSLVDFASIAHDVLGKHRNLSLTVLGRWNIIHRVFSQPGNFTGGEASGLESGLGVAVLDTHIDGVPLQFRRWTPTLIGCQCPETATHRLLMAA
jgi:hypothetical protein